MDYDQVADAWYQGVMRAKGRYKAGLQTERAREFRKNQMRLGIQLMAANLRERLRRFRQEFPDEAYPIPSECYHD